MEPKFVLKLSGRMVTINLDADGRAIRFDVDEADDTVADDTVADTDTADTDDDLVD